MNNKFEFDPYIALKSLVEITSVKTGENFIKTTAIEIKKLFKADLVYISKANDFNPTTKVDVLYSTNDKVPSQIDLNGIPGKFVFENKIIKITQNVQYNFLKNVNEKYESFCGIPMTDEDDHCIGHIAVYSKEIREIPDEINDIAFLFAKKIQTELKRLELEIENKKIRKQLEEIAITDTLTNLYNRRYFQKICSDIFAQVKRDAVSATLAYIDMDNFKTINDRFGHQGGDIVLKDFAQILEKESRKGSDYLFRLGGEEFCIISLNTPLNYSYEHLARIMTKTMNKFRDTRFGEVTLSIGLVKFDKTFDSYHDILDLADKKMYRAKKAGKNTIVK